MISDAISMRILSDTLDNRHSVNTLLHAATDYHLLVEGAAPTHAHVDEFFTSVPDGHTLNDLFPLGFFMGDTMIGGGGILHGWNAPNKAMIGLLLFAPEWRRDGCGRAAVAHIETLSRSWPGIDRLRVGVVGNNTDALTFWRKVGFIDTGEIKPKYAPYIEDIVILEKPLYP
ncbi:MAG: GNAT family N-acetyltransferase [Betaproteobacteria bacterium]